MSGKLLVTGVSGFLGWHICRKALAAGWCVAGTCFSRPVEIEGVAVHTLDLRDGEAVSNLLDALRPDAVIHAAAMANPNLCELHPDDSAEANITATRNLAQWCGDTGIPMVFTSTDLVFAGDNPPYDEQAQTAPLMVYGQHKVEAEKLVMGLVEKGCVCRMPLMFGLRSGEPASFVGSWFDKLKNGETLTLFDDEFRTPVSGQDAAEGLLLALQKKFCGVLHLGGRESISRYKFGLSFCRAFGFSEALIKAVPMASIKMAAPRAVDVSLDSRQAFDLGFNPGLVSDPSQLRAMIMG